MKGAITDKDGYAAFKLGGMFYPGSTIYRKLAQLHGKMSKSQVQYQTL